jgi:ABC-type antimicrobial peptide transport system permease subunit
MIVREILGLVALGIAVGVPLIVASTRLISAHLFGIGGLDPVTIAIARLLLTAIGAAAGYLPARQAARMSPIAVLRDA